MYQNIKETGTNDEETQTIEEKEEDAVKIKGTGKVMRMINIYYLNLFLHF